MIIGVVNIIIVTELTHFKMEDRKNSSLYLR